MRLMSKLKWPFVEIIESATPFFCNTEKWYGENRTNRTACYGLAFTLLFELERLVLFSLFAVLYKTFHGAFPTHIIIRTKKINIHRLTCYHCVNKLLILDIQRSVVILQRLRKIQQECTLMMCIILNSILHTQICIYTKF